ncbi:MAG TPA: hypothetical protein VF489_01055 [Sphingobium sp.]
MSAALLRRAAGIVEARAEERRAAVAQAMLDAGVEEARVEGEVVRLSGRGLLRRWLADIGLREAGRGRG